MASLNKVFLIGNITRDLEIRYTPKGSAVCDMGLAVNRRYTTDTGESREEVAFLDVVLWGKQAEFATKYLGKGRPVFIEGRLQMESWEDKTSGQKRHKIKIVCENIQFVDSKPGGGGPRGGGTGDSYDEGGGGGDDYRPPARPAQRPSPAGAASSRPPQRPQPASDEFSDGPITEGMEEDDIPF